MNEDRHKYYMPVRNAPEHGTYHKWDHRTSGEKKREKMRRRQEREKYNQEQRDGLHSYGYYHRKEAMDRERREQKAFDKFVAKCFLWFVIIMFCVATYFLWDYS